MKLRFVSDYVCPYCYAAKLPLQEYLKKHPETEIEWIPFELTVPPKPRVDTYNDPIRRASYEKYLAPLNNGMKLPPNVVPHPYTTLAFEGWHFAVDHGCGDAYNDAVYHAYFIDERDIGSADVLTDIAVSCGMDATAFRAALDNGTYAQKQREAARYSREVLGVKGVPAIFIDDELLPDGIYTEAGFEELLRSHTSAPSAPVCGEDGCRFN